MAFETGTDKDRGRKKEHAGEAKMLTTVCASMFGVFSVSYNEYMCFEGCLDVGVWGLNSVAEIIHWGDGLHAFLHC